jgi:hydroxyacylglutathione hydrolase
MLKSMLEILPIPAFADNYIWLLKKGAHAVVVDPGDATPVIAKLNQLSLTLDAILVTHHHADHTGGVNELLKHWPAQVYAPSRDRYDFPHLAVTENSVVHLASLDLDLNVMEVPGHTLDHVAYYDANKLFCGDTLFAGGCGRLFEGTAEQMYCSLQRFAALPGDTAVYCGHEYTEHNLDFALSVEPGNQALKKRHVSVLKLRLAHQPTLPSTIDLELQTNPFLRCDQPAIQRTADLNAKIDTKNYAISVFSKIREMRNHY